MPFLIKLCTLLSVELDSGDKNLRKIYQEDTPVLYYLARNEENEGLK